MKPFGTCALLVANVLAGILCFGAPNVGSDNLRATVPGPPRSQSTLRPIFQTHALRIDFSSMFLGLEVIQDREEGVVIVHEQALVAVPATFPVAPIE